ncbi:MAG: CD1845 family protein [Dehalococcoidia bacterium]|nr:CD1845 family protein [Dehalococcoidia bacterium]
MRTFFKILAMPFVMVLFILCPVLAFIFGTAKLLLNYLLILFILLSLGLFFLVKNIPAGIAFAITALLISPIGIPLVADWLIDKLCDLKDSLDDFVKS